MRYFRYFPKTIYSDNLIDQVKTLDIIGRAKVIDMLDRKVTVFYDWIIQDGERPDIIAHKYYNSVDYTWLVLLANKIRDPQYDWPLTYPQFISFIQKKYGSIETAQSTIHHYEDEIGMVVDSDFDDAVSITVYDYEDRLNEAKRNIKLIDNDFVSQIEEELRRLFK